MEVNTLQVRRVTSERVKVAPADPAPVDEFDAELERRLRRRDEVVFVDAKHRIEVDERRDRGFADADGPDLLGLDQRRFGAAIIEVARQGRSRHPAGGSAADDHDIADGMLITHAASLPRRSR